MGPRLGAIALLFLLGGCSTLHYYGQAAGGQLQLILQREPVEELLAQDRLSEARRDQLQRAMDVLAFAEDELSLAVGDSYRSYVELERDYVVWNVFAAPEFSLEPRQWCYPVAGCLGYRGYFSAGAAHDHAERLRDDGYDVYVGGVAAYSTLGWFNDPLLSTMLDRPPHRLAAVLLHELAHRSVYVAGDTAFNEGYASLVEREGLRLWLESRGNAALFDRFLRERRREQAFVSLVQKYRERLRDLYQQELTPARMRERKSAIQQELREAYRQLAADWETDPYRAWFEGPLNNAQLSTVSAYHRWVPAFARLLQRSDCQWSRFHERVRELGELAPEAREAALQALTSTTADTGEACPDGLADEY